VLRLTKRYPFSASHRLHTAKLSDGENVRLFGKCNNPFGHGHNYVLEVSLAGEPDAQSGMMLSRPELDAFVERTVLSKIDHADLNAGVPEFQDVVPTTENLALLIDRWLRHAWPREFGGRPIQLARIRIEETGRNSFEVVNHL
jgi:6-pyruvoyltetrahydropterin/6-carboxytetrahydropterin synthase